MECYVNGYRVSGNHLAHVGGREYHVEDSSGVVHKAEGKVAACDWAENRKAGDMSEPEPPVVAAPVDPVVETKAVEEPQVLNAFITKYGDTTDKVVEKTETKTKPVKKKKATKK